MHESNGGPRRVLAVIALLLSLAGLLFVSVLLANTQESQTMPTPAAPTQTKIEIPPIDANAPTSTKMATFAMG